MFHELSLYALGYRCLRGQLMNILLFCKAEKAEAKKAAAKKEEQRSQNSHGEDLLSSAGRAGLKQWLLFSIAHKKEKASIWEKKKTKGFRFMPQTPCPEKKRG